MQRTVRLWRWRRNPLKRRSDVVEAWAGLAAGVVMAVGAPISGIAAAHSMHDSIIQQNQDRHRVSATLTHDAPGVATTRAEGANPDRVRAPVQWHDASGRTHSAHVTVAPGAKAGTTTPVWVDGRQQVTEPPLDAVQATVQTDIIGAGAAGGFCVAALAAHRLVRLDLDRRRSRQWQREWEKVGPQWSGHHT
jgi:hypothetical protein